MMRPFARTGLVLALVGATATAAAVFFAVVGLLTPLEAASPPAGSGSGPEQLVLTVHEQCSCSWQLDREGVSHHDEVTATLEERIVYRITKYDGGEGLADLELVSDQKNVTSQGSGTWRAAGASRSWTYQPYQVQSTLVGVEISFTRGWLQVSAPNNPCSHVKKSDDLAVAGDFAHTYNGSEELRRQLRYTFTPNSKTVVAHGHASYSVSPVPGLISRREVDYSVSVGGSSDPDIEVVITPPAGLKDWDPKGGKDEVKPGDTLVFKGEVRQKRGKKQDKDHKVKFQLLTSAIPGICNNYPRKVPKDPTPDLRILQEGTSPQLKNIRCEGANEGDYHFLYLTEGRFKVGDKFTLAVGSYDYGAYGKLSVESDPDVPVRIEGYSGTTIKLPRDDNNNHIADAWEEKNLPPSYSNDANSDDDVSYKNKNNGDGFSLYEEYRGFMVKGKHEGKGRTDPSKKDLFIWSNMPEKTRDGIKLFGSTTGIEVHEINKDEMDDTYVMNFNSSYSKIADQHAKMIFVLDQEKYKKAAGKLLSGHSGGHTDVCGNKIKVLNVGEFSSTVVHELGHSVCIEHHGDGNYFGDEKKDVAAKLEDEAKQLGIPLDKLYVAVQGGENSGDEQCFMRYYVANFIERVVDGGKNFIRMVGRRGEVPVL